MIINITNPEVITIEHTDEGGVIESVEIDKVTNEEIISHIRGT